MGDGECIRGGCVVYVCEVHVLSLRYFFFLIFINLASFFFVDPYGRLANAASYVRPLCPTLDSSGCPDRRLAILAPRLFVFLLLAFNDHLWGLILPDSLCVHFSLSLFFSLISAGEYSHVARAHIIEIYI